MVLINNDFEQDLWNTLPDVDDYTTIIPTGAANDGDRLAQITLKKLTPVPTAVQLSHPPACAAVRSRRHSTLRFYGNRDYSAHARPLPFRLSSAPHERRHRRIAGRVEANTRLHLHDRSEG